jgi:GTP pyrophosphokinase
MPFVQSNYAYRIMQAKWIDSSQQEFKAIINITGMDTLGLYKVNKSDFQYAGQYSKYILNGDAGLFKDNCSCSSEQ